MAGLDFPNSSASPYIAPNGFEYEWDSAKTHWYAACEPPVPVSSPIINVRNNAVGIDYSNYTYVWDVARDAEYTGSYWSVIGPGEPNDIYDGNETTRFYRSAKNKVKIELRFAPPTPIRVDGLIEIKGGFHGNSRAGDLKVNGQVVLTLNAWDEQPQWFSTRYSGSIYNFSLGQKNLPPSSSPKAAYTFSMTSMKIDGQYLISNRGVTELTFQTDQDISTWSYNDRIVQCDSLGKPLSTGVGTVGEVKVSERKVSFLEAESGWAVGNYARNITQNPL